MKVNGHVYVKGVDFTCFTIFLFDFGIV